MEVKLTPSYEVDYLSPCEGSLQSKIMKVVSLCPPNRYCFKTVVSRAFTDPQSFRLPHSK